MERERPAGRSCRACASAEMAGGSARDAESAMERVERDPEGGAAAVAEGVAVEEEAEAHEIGQHGGGDGAAGALVELLEDLAEALVVERVVLHRRVQLLEALLDLCLQFCWLVEL